VIAHEPQDLVNAFAQALNAKDPEALGLLFIEHAEFVNNLGMRMRGRKGIVAGHAWAFGGPRRGRHVRFHQIGELAFTADVSILHCHCLRELELDAPADGLPAGASLPVFLARRSPAAWEL
jgi:uncharacterized protein (TIGR02246 family)